METANANRDGEQVAAHIKASDLDVHSKPQLSRREREAIEKERKRKNYQEAYAQVLPPPPTLCATWTFVAFLSSQQYDNR